MLSPVPIDHQRETEGGERKGGEKDGLRFDIRFITKIICFLVAFFEPNIATQVDPFGAFDPAPPKPKPKPVTPKAAPAPKPAEPEPVAASPPAPKPAAVPSPSPTLASGDFSKVREMPTHCITSHVFVTAASSHFPPLFSPSLPVTSPVIKWRWRQQRKRSALPRTRSAAQLVP